MNVLFGRIYGEWSSPRSLKRFRFLVNPPPVRYDIEFSRNVGGDNWLNSSAIMELDLWLSNSSCHCAFRPWYRGVYIDKYKRLLPEEASLNEELLFSFLWRVKYVYEPWAACFPTFAKRRRNWLFQFFLGFESLSHRVSLVLFSTNGILAIDSVSDSVKIVCPYL